jgi:hypothetical protein
MVTVFVSLEHADQMSTLQEAVRQLRRRHAACHVEALSDSIRIHFPVDERHIALQSVWNAISRAQMMLLLEPLDSAIVGLVIHRYQLS